MGVASLIYPISIGIYAFERQNLNFTHSTYVYNASIVTSIQWQIYFLRVPVMGVEAIMFVRVIVNILGSSNTN